MSQININISTPNDGLGDPLRSAFNSTNQNFTELYTNKVDKISGKGLSSNDYTTTEKNKLAGIAAGAEVNVQANLLQEDNTADDYVIGRDIISDFVPKIERFKVVVSTNSIGVTLNDGRHFIEMTNASQGQLNYLVLGTDFTGGENNPLIIRNNTGINFNIGHLVPSGSSFAGENLFFFQNASNFQLKNKEIISFVYDIDNNRYEFSGIIPTVITSVTNIVSSALASQNSAGMATWINANSFTVANNEIKQFQVTDTGQVFELLLRGRSFGSSTPAVSYIDVLDYGGTGVSLSANNTWTGIQTFLATKLGLRNVADTFTSYFTNTNTASRTYTLQNRSMTVAGTDDIAITSLDEGNGIGYVISGRNAANYGNVGLGAIDLSTSNSASSSKGATAPNSTVSGGLNNTAGNTGAVISGGESNIATSSYDTIGGGNLNSISGSNSTISGGQSNTINAGNAAIGGGNGNNVSGSYGIISGGLNNTLTAIYSAIIGGVGNNTNGDGSISGGVAMTAASYAEIALGTYGTNYTAGSTSAIVGTDRIFNIGNGANGGARSNAFTILKNGLATLPSVTNTLIKDDTTGKAIITREYINRTFTVATLPTVASGVAYATVTDATAPTYLGVLIGGGSVVTPVFYNGTAWVSH